MMSAVTALVEGVQIASAVYSAGKGVYHFATDSGEIHTISTHKHPELKNELKRKIGDRLNQSPKKRQKVSLTTSFKEKILNILGASSASEITSLQHKVSSSMPRYAASKYAKKKAPKRRVPKAIAVRRVFPATQTYELQSFHQGALDATTGGAVAYGEINIANPLNPLEAGVAFNLSSNEHHPRYWNILADLLYQKFTVLETHVSIQFIDEGNSKSHFLFIVPSNSASQTETINVIQDTFTAGTRLKEINKMAVVRHIATSAEQAGNNTLSLKVNNQRLEDLKSTEATLLQGTTSVSATEAAPARTPKVYFGIGALGGVDLTNVYVIIKLTQKIRFDGLVTNLDGANV